MDEFYSSDSNSNYSNEERMEGEPGIVVSEEHPEIGPILTMLLSTLPVQKSLNRELDEPLVWTRDWCTPGTHTSSPQGTLQEPQSVLAELMKLCAHVHMSSGRTRADASLLVSALKDYEFTDLEEFLAAVEPLRSQLGLDTDGTQRYSLALENAEGNLCSQLDATIMGKSAKFGPLILAQVDCQNSLQIDEYWYPQRCSRELAEIGSLYRHVKVDMEQAMNDARRRRNELRFFKGADVEKMLMYAAETMQSYARSGAADKLGLLAEKLGHERNDLMDQMQNLKSDITALTHAYDTFDDLLFTTLKHEPVNVKRYKLVGLMLSAQEYYAKYQNLWFYVRDDSPSECRFQTVQDAGRDAQTVLAVWSIDDTDAEELEPSQTIKDFCLQEMQAMSTSPEPEAALSEFESEDGTEPDRAAEQTARYATSDLESPEVIEGEVHGEPDKAI